MSAQGPKLQGDIVLLPGINSRWAALLALALAAALIALLSLGSYTRRSTVSGQLIPSEGLLKVTSAQVGVVVERHATDGRTVKRGDVLFVLSGDREGPGALGFQRGIALQIESRRRSLEDKHYRNLEGEQQDAEQLRRRIRSLRTESERIHQQDSLLAQRLSSAQDTVRRYQTLVAQGFASRDEMAAKENDHGELLARREGLRREALAAQRDIGASERELAALAARAVSQRAELDRAIALTHQEFAEIESRRRVIVAAPADGRLTLVQAEVGQAIEPGKALAQLLPGTSQLIARLYVPSRAAGFVKPGDTVLLRFDAFPFEKFGQLSTRVATMSKAAVPSSELQGLAMRPELAAEPVFAVNVVLPERFAAGGRALLPLQAGMTVEADLLHESRRLYEWMIEPLLGIQARLNDG